MTNLPQAPKLVVMLQATMVLLAIFVATQDTVMVSTLPLGADTVRLMAEHVHTANVLIILRLFVEKGLETTEHQPFGQMWMKRNLPWMMRVQSSSQQYIHPPNDMKSKAS